MKCKSVPTSPSRLNNKITRNKNGASDTKDQDRLLPIANVGRIMKKSLPPNAKISKEAKETVQECVSEFISFITGEASDKCQKEKRKTVNGDDVLWAMTTLGFENYVEPLKISLSKYRENEGEKIDEVAKQELNNWGQNLHKRDNEQFEDGVIARKSFAEFDCENNGMRPSSSSSSMVAPNLHFGSIEW